MSLIACTHPCLYQEDGQCTLDRALSSGTPTNLAACVHFLPKRTGVKDK